MTQEQPEPTVGESDPTIDRITLIAGVTIATLGVGWFALSHFIMGTPAFEAVGEALGVTFALMVVGSIVGAVTSGRRRPR